MMLRCGLCVLGMLTAVAAHAAEAVYVQPSTAQVGTRTVARPAGQATQPVQSQAQAFEQLQSQFWGLSLDEVRRANLLMQGPRGAFSVPNITPIEVLGIHARSEAERRKYAEMFARALHDDTERVLAWANAHAEAMARLYPNEKVIDFSTVRSKPVVDSAVAEAALVPQSAIIPAQPARPHTKGRTR